MDSLFNLPLPFQRRLTKMYTDTKSSYDFVTEPVQAAEDPELLSLHRKLRIQKDRLVSWGMEWSDSTQSPDIDESITKAGLSEVVGSVMSMIKEILAEAEPLWQSSRASKRALDEKGESVDRKVPLIVWDKSRFEDLVKDLTMSIDTLYDLSRTRQAARKSSAGKSMDSPSSLQTKSPSIEERQFESTRMQAPRQIDPRSIIWPRDLKAMPLKMLPPAKASRQIVFMKRPTSLPDSRKAGNQALPTVPVLLEHAPYDPIYTMTGITPSMTRFERLFAALTQAYISSDRVLSGLLRLIGYFEEAEHSRFCLLYSLPTHFGPVDIENPRMPTITILADLLHTRNFEPTLEAKFRLAHNVANAVFDLHAKGVVHGNLVPANILFIEHQSETSYQLDFSQVNVRQSYLTSFDLFSDAATDSSVAASDSTVALYRHPLDPRTTRYTHFTSENKSLDLYSLAMLLLEIGLWSSLPEIFPTSQIPENPVAVFKSLANRCGTLYMKAVKACWKAPDDELSQKARPDVMLQKVLGKVSKSLNACCTLDDMSSDETEESESALVVPPAEMKPLPPTPVDTSIRHEKAPMLSALITNPSMDLMAMPSLTPPPPPKLERSGRVKSSGPHVERQVLSEKSPINTSSPVQPLQRPKSKLRTYPGIRISQEHLDYWHTVLMPRINYVLRGFYKNYPESVEISLESIGESSTKTKPTILVICTSVNQVRTILKKSLGFDKAVYGLKVCRGKIVRSRKHGARRSMANELCGDMKPANGDHQERPRNGASIGAYVGEKHLPPVSLGGIIIIDDKPYGMTVHHMLDDPSDAEEEQPSQEPILRSSARYLDMPDLTHSESSVYSSGDEEFAYTLSDYDSGFSSHEESEADNDFSDEDAGAESDDGQGEPGDIRGISPGHGTSYIITQPAIDDVAEDFYPCDETRDEDHLDSFSLGELYASSGIRRRGDENGIVHEIDWALFEFTEDRRPEMNCIDTARRFCKSSSDTYPLSIAPVAALSDLAVHCVARTSGLQTGRILPGMVIVKIFGRTTASSSFQVAGKLGVPGDSGAWVVDNEHGRACGVVLAWSSRKRVAYICPMEVVLRDVKEVVGAATLRLPGGDEVFVSDDPRVVSGAGGAGAGAGGEVKSETSVDIDVNVANDDDLDLDIDTELSDILRTLNVRDGTSRSYESKTLQVHIDEAAYEAEAEGEDDDEKERKDGQRSAHGQAQQKFGRFVKLDRGEREKEREKERGLKTSVDGKAGGIKAKVKEAVVVA